MTTDRETSPAPLPVPVRSRIAVLASGGGSNLQTLLDHFAGPASHMGDIVWVGSDKPTAGAMTRAQAAGVATGVIANPADGGAIIAQLDAAGADLLVLAGYLRLIPEAVVRAFQGRLLNIHPALLPAFGGPGMYGMRIHSAVIEHGALVTGATVHFVDEHYDRGPIIAQWPVPVLPGDTPAMLAARVLRVEHRLFPLCVAAVASGAIVLGDDGRVHGHLDVPVGLAAPEWRFGLVADVANDAPLFATDVARLFPR
ncbi:phosphoribosylglycinamide formyltransferase [Gemmatimonas phototrophica]|uniref:Phosphoribosylglycinamide formyltransferase n=1 Tax=Gemmatimonas phototrophica TaxID=1379270 RepID=A0A143BJE0_9BACT|nr:phosphoribosylglycinamide formyltransferase [Gemmatimonas phototrophica]AMW04695.1 phosphoribosylglycinamide formyltransferase [Gemmatimonas phototrophica]